MELDPRTSRAPELAPECVNPEPLTLKVLRARAVFVDFLDYACANCIRALPSVAEWRPRYASKRLTIVGVHFVPCAAAAGG